MCESIVTAYNACPDSNLTITQPYVTFNCQQAVSKCWNLNSIIILYIWHKIHTIN